MLERDRQRRGFWFLRRRPETIAADVNEELALHLEMRVEQLIASGLPPQAAREEALRQFGDLEYTRRYCRHQDLEKETHMRRGLMFEELAQDARISLRSLRRVPVMAAAILVTVGLGIAATTVIFAAVDAALLRPLPYRDPERLVRIYTDSPPNRFRFSVVDCQALEAEQTRFDSVAAYTDRAMGYSDGAVAERLRGREVSWAYFTLLGLRPSLGRDFTRSDGQPGAPPVVIVSAGFWKRRLGGRLDTIGRPLLLDGTAHTLVGVLPESVGPLEQRQEFFIAAQWPTPQRKGPFFYTALGRLRGGVERSAAAEELRAISRRLFPLWRSSYQDDRATWGMIDLKAHVVGDVHATAGLALAAVALLWLIACANASNLLVARVTSRRPELVIRAALGASRGRVVRYLLAESLLLAVGSAGVGAGLAWLGVRLMRDFGATYFPRTQEITLAGPALWLLVALTAASALLFGLVPAAHGTGGALDESLRAQSRSTSSSPAARRVRRALVASQFAIATPLVVVAALLAASLNKLGRVDLGFDTHNVVSGAITLPAAQYPEDGRVEAFWTELQGRVAALPGVSHVAFADERPPEAGNFNNFELEDAPTPPGGSQPVAPWVSVTPEYFRLLGLTLFEGRPLDENDARRPSVEAVVVDRAWAKRFFPNGSAVGKRMKEGGCTTCPWTTVVGVVGDVKYAGLNKPNEGAIYAPLDPGARSRYLLLRSSVGSATVPGVLGALRGLDPSLPLSSLASIDDLVARELQQPRSLSLLVGGFAAVALVLSVVGIYGMMAFYVQQHLRDISIRLVLGGSPADVLRLIVVQGMTIVTSGVAIGLVGALFLARSASSLLFGVGPGDPLTFGLVGSALLMVAVAACCVPAARAMRLQPAALLRNE